jgi:enoyl-CoA hydratase/carnithine racemase
VVCIAGEGRNFSAGLDFGSSWKDVYTPKDASANIPSYFGQRQYSLMASKLYAIPQVVVAAAHGPTVGVGFALFCASNIRIASADWRASIGANRMGLSGGEGGLTWLLPRIVGSGLATEVRHSRQSHLFYLNSQSPFKSSWQHIAGSTHPKPSPAVS